MLKKIWIIAPFTSVERLDDRNRFQYIAKSLSRKYETHLFTSDFIHLKKVFRDADIKDKFIYKLHLIHEKGYQKNISIRRAISHIMFAFNLKKEIKNMRKPDLIYCAYPTMTSAYFMGKFAERNKIPFILDIQDTWPESISAGLNTRNLFIKGCMFPFTVYANIIYRLADVIIGVSETYANRGKVKGTKAKEFISVYIGAEGNKFENIDINNMIEKSNSEIWITYIGTLSHSYDIETALDAFGLLKNESRDNIKLYILGIGSDYKKLKEKAMKLDILNKTVFFKGLLEYKTMIAYLKKSDIALNAIKKDALQTITNKFGDYVSAGLPILNSCCSEEVLSLIEEKELGENYIPGDSVSLKEKILFMLRDENKLKEYGENSKNFSKEKFDRKNSYQNIFSIIDRTLFKEVK
ncbi:glycosyltransferase family 4 protein [Fusobacterium sp.]|uniref:glycosyltransferase family 4 protein n=1 Tax=Fusobacterium sp. TaxID=68766 RepID=UPI000C6FD684|nr:glycosyltransferase family 4 protein [Fusobacterium sp.]